MRLSGNLILGLLAVNGLAQTLVPDQGQEPSAIAQPEPSPPAAEEPSVPVQDQPSVPADDDDTSRTDAEEAPEATPVPEPTADTPEETADASQISEGDQPTATASDDNDDEATTAAEETATADATATEDNATATATKIEVDNDATDTATLTATSSFAPTSTAAVIDINLNNATIGENAELVQVDGKPTIKLSAPANGQATFSVLLESDNDDFSSSELIYIVASILVGEASGSAKLRRRDTKTDCTLQIQAGGQTVYDEPLYTNNGEFQDVTSSGISSSDMGTSSVEVTQKCGEKPSPITVNNVRAGNKIAVKSSGGSGSGGSGSGSGGSGSSGRKGGSGSGSGSGPDGTSTGTGDSGNLASKAKASVGALAAAVLAAAALF